MTAQRVVLSVVITLLAAWCIYMLADARQWALIVVSGLVPSGAVIHAAVLARRGQLDTANTVLSWMLATMVAFAAFSGALTDAGQAPSERALDGE